MQKFLNNPSAFAYEYLDGLVRAHPDLLVSVGESGQVIARVDAPIAGRVAIVTGGGSGHLPLFPGYVGPGLVSAAAVGNVFSSPASSRVMEATRAVNSGAGVLYLYGNYSGDVLSFDAAAEQAGEEGIEVASVRGADDIGSAPAERRAERRGTAGLVFAFKCAGAAAEQGASLQEVVRVAKKVGENIATFGVGLGPTILPTTGHASFELPEGMMELGIGIHGEPGKERIPLESADAISRRLTEGVVADLGLANGERVAVLVNGLGATPAEELYLLWRGVAATLDAMGVRLERSLVGEYVTSMDMAGASVSVLRLDDELLSLIDAPARSVGYRS